MPKYDTIVVGSGAGGSSVAYKLAKAGKRVLLIEKGPFVPRDASTLDVRQVFVDGVFTNHVVWSDGRGREFVPSEFHNVGGKTKWYGAALFRFRPVEFEAEPEFDLLGWPFGYDELARYYDEATELLGITTFENEPGRLFIGGQWREASDGARADVIDPSTGQVVTTVAEAGAADVDAAVRAARETFDSGTWSGLSGRERGRIRLPAAPAGPRCAPRAADGS